MLCLAKIIYHRSWKIPPNQSILLKYSFIKVRTGIAYSEKLHAFINSIREVHQQQYKKFVDSRLFSWQKKISDTVMRNGFVTPGM